MNYLYTNDSFLRWKVGDRSNGADIITQYGQHIDIDQATSLAEQIDDAWLRMSTKEMYETIIKQHIKSLGAFYSLAIVSLIKKGAEPIYDKLAETAFDVILEKCGFRKRWNIKRCQIRVVYLKFLSVTNHIKRSLIRCV